MIFAAGLGTRLKPFTLSHPKALVTVGGVPMLGRVIASLRRQGITEIVVNVHHFADQIVNYLRTGDFGVDIRISDESEMLLDTGGGVLKAAPMLRGNDPILLYNADILCNIDLGDMLRHHRTTGADVTLLAQKRDTSRHLCFDNATGRLAGWVNTTTGESRPKEFIPSDMLTGLAFGGIHIISQKVLDALAVYPDAPKFSLTPFYVDNCSELDIRAYTPHNDIQWFDIGKPETLEKARSYVDSTSGIVI